MLASSAREAVLHQGSQKRKMCNANPISAALQSQVNQHLDVITYQNLDAHQYGPGKAT